MASARQLQWFVEFARAALLCSAFAGASAVASEPSFAEDAPLEDIAAALGRVNVAGYSKRSHCTGALIAPNKVLTAAHCLKNANGRPARPENIHFLPGADRGAYLAHGRAACVVFARGGKGLKSDAAVIHLRAPLSIAPAPVRKKSSPALKEPVLLSGYSRRRPHRLTTLKKCLVRSKQAGLLAADCAAENGMSGGPALTFAKGGALEIAAIIVARTQSSRTALLPVEAWSGLLNSKCPPARPSTPPGRAAQGSSAPR